MQAQVQYFAAEPQVSHQKYRDEEYYEQLTDLPDDESKIKIDYFVDRPPTPEYKPMEKGIDVWTQIESFEPDLFHYELEVEPVLQVLVGRSLEQARMELFEESEYLELQAYKQRFEKKRNAELMVTQRMEAAYVRRKEERERRILQHKLYLQQLKLSQSKFIARSLTKLALRGTKQRVLADLDNLGYLRNDPLLDLKVNTIPWLIKQIELKQKRNAAYEYSYSRHVHQFNQLLDNVQLPIQDEHQKHYSVEMNRRRVILEERERVRVEIEERKKRKAEIKRRRVIKEKREIQRSAIYNNTIAKAEAVQTIFNAKIIEGIANQEKGTVLPFDFLLLLAESLDLIGAGHLDQIDDEIIDTIWIDLLLNKLNIFEINLHEEIKQQIQDALALLEENVLIFERHHKEQTINTLTQQTKWANQFSANKAATITPELLNRLLKGLYNILFKSINYKDVPVKSKTEEAAPPQQEPQEGEAEVPQIQQEQVQVQEEEEYHKPEITQHDTEQVEAKKKIHINYSTHQKPQITAIVNLLVPCFLPEPPRMESQQQSLPDIHTQEHIQIQDEPAQPPVGKWDFDPKTIDIYDGEQPLIQEGNRAELECLYQYQFQEPVYVNDYRALELARLQMFHYLKIKLESFMNVPDSLTYKDEKFSSNVPIYDYEL